MKNISYIAIVGLLTMAGCTNDDFVERIDGSKDSFTTLYATMGDIAATRAQLTTGDVEGNMSVVWDENDKIGVFSDTQNTITSYTLSSVTDGGTAVFTGDEVSGNTYYAVYPNRYADQITIDENNHQLLHIKSTSVNHFWSLSETETGNYMFDVPMVAKSTDSKFSFKQTVGVIHFSIGDLGKVKDVYITIRGNNNEQMNGNGYIDLSEEEPVFRLDSDEDNNNFLKSGVKGTDIVDGKASDCYFAVPPMTFEKGISLSIEGEDENGDRIRWEKCVSSPLTIERATVKHFSLVNVNAEIEEYNEQTRQVLMDIFQATDGEHWTHNDNWGSDKPINEWYGVDFSRYGYMSMLNLENNNLSGAIPESIKSLTHLDILKLNWNDISLPECIGELINLHELWLGGKNTKIDIPESIWNLPHLWRLSIYNSSLTEIPECIGDFYMLSYLWVTNGNVKEIPEAISNLTNLQSLHLGGNQIKNIPATIIGSLINLDNLYLNDNQIEDIPDDIGKLTSLTTLYLNNNLLTEIPESIQNLTNLEHLYLSKNNLTGSFPDFLTKLTNLEHLSIDDNYYSGTIPQEIQQSDWWNNLSWVKYQHQKDNKELLLSDQEGRDALCDFYNDSNGKDWTNQENWLTHRSLDLWYGISTLSDGHITSINLNSNNLQGNVTKAIYHLLGLKELYSLDLSGNLLEGTGNVYHQGDSEHQGEDGVDKDIYEHPFLPEAIIQLPNLTYLYLYNNNIGGCIRWEMQETDWWKEKAGLFKLTPQNGDFSIWREFYTTATGLTYKPYVD